MDVERQRVCSEFDQSPTLRFQITVDNVRSLLRLSDKFEIEYLLNEIKVGSSRDLLLIQIFSAHWVTQVHPSYDLWELGARYELEYLERHCRLAARKRADEILAKGEGYRISYSEESPFICSTGLYVRYSMPEKPSSKRITKVVKWLISNERVSF